MKLFPFLFVFAVALLTSCGHSGHHPPEAGDAIETDGNAALYSEVNKIHEEAMEKMDVMARVKRELESKLAIASEEGKAEIGRQIAKLDSADKGMWDWMHNYTKAQDTLSDEEYREYLEAEIIRAKKVRDDIAEALKGAAE